MEATIVADFDGDGFADVATLVVPLGGSTPGWAYSKQGRSNWFMVSNTSFGLAGYPVGRFDGNNTADVVVWSGHGFWYAPGLHDPIPLGLHSMR